jgi:hypothetical protein
MYAVHDENGKQIVVDRVSKRIETLAYAQRVRVQITANPGNLALVETVVELAVQLGGFLCAFTETVPEGAAH